MAKKNIFERMGLVEKVEDDYEPPYEEDQNFEAEEELPEVNTEGVSQDNLVADIYTANNLTDMDNSIFKAEEIKATLPATMTTEAMKATVIGILASFKLTLDGLAQDAVDRTEVLKAACAQITKDNTDIIDERKSQIEEAKHLIEGWEKDIAERESVIAKSVETINAEIKRIANLNTFLGGE